MDIPKGSKNAELVYKNTVGRNLMLTFLPPIQKKYEKSPVYFLIPGGGWHMEVRQDMINFSIKSVEMLRNEGFAVVCTDYRICSEGVVMSEIITDCFDAARYVAHYADVFEIDKEKFVMSGHSAGGHLALMLSYAPQDMFEDGYEFSDRFKVIASAPLSPPTALHEVSTHNLRDIGDVFVGCDTREEKERMSPVTYVSDNCPPTVLCAGTSDYLVFSVSSEKLYKKLQEFNVPCELNLSVGGGHCFEKIHDNIEPDISAEEMQDTVIDFILKYL